MRKILLLAFTIFVSFAGQAQTFTTASGSQDTVYGSYVSGTTLDLHNNITPSSSTPVTLKWKVTAMNFSAGWDATASGICDNRLCRYDVNALYGNFNSEKSDPYTATGDFHVSFAANNPSIGSKAVVTVRATDTVANYTRNLTFIVYRAALGIGQSNIGDNSVSVYPNPARDFVNVTFDAQSDIKTIAIFNLIGKTVRVFKPTDNNSARLDLDNIPSGVYFVRLMNGVGQVIATRRFTRQ